MQRAPHLRQLDYPHFPWYLDQNSFDLIPRSKRHQGTYNWMKTLAPELPKSITGAWLIPPEEPLKKCINLLHPSKDLQLPVFTQCEDINNTKYILKVNSAVHSAFSDLLKKKNTMLSFLYRIYKSKNIYMYIVEINQSAIVIYSLCL